MVDLGMRWSGGDGIDGCGSVWMRWIRGDGEVPSLGWMTELPAVEMEVIWRETLCVERDDDG